MNAKRVKRIRKQLRASGISPRQAEYGYTEGSIRRGNPFAMQIILSPDCGRYIYKQLKRQWNAKS